MAFQHLIPGGPSVQDDLSQVIPGGPSLAVEAAAVAADIVRATETEAARGVSVTRYADLVRAAETSSARVLSHGPAQMRYLSLVDVAYAHGPEDIEFEVEVEDIAA